MVFARDPIRGSISDGVYSYIVVMLQRGFVVLRWPSSSRSSTPEVPPPLAIGMIFAHHPSTDIVKPHTPCQRPHRWVVSYPLMGSALIG